MTERPDFCIDCIFFDELGVARRDAGLCRRHAPAWPSIDQACPLWPEVRAKDWCGDGESNGKSLDG